MVTVAPRRVHAVVVGAGFGGLCLATKLREAGLEDFVVLEQASGLGGVWRDNRYPGCACDVASHLYSFSFGRRHDWSRKYASSVEIWRYLEGVADEYGLRPYLRFGAGLARAERTREGRWVVDAADGSRWSAEILVLAIGGLSRPQLAQLPGLETFAGPSFHSGAWRDDVPLEGRRVGVIGTGASAIQFVPHVAARAGHLSVFQRTPPWILPKGDRAFTPRERALFRAWPTLARLYRASIDLRHDLLGLGLYGPSALNRVAERMCRAHLTAQIPDPALRKKLTPEYRVGCKRVLISDDYYPALTQPHVALVTDAVERVVPTGIETRDGAFHPLDVLIQGTGFAVHDYVGRAEIVNGAGESLGARWRRGAEAYLGTTVAGFPNLFVVTGPNTGLGHSSIVLMIEAQVRYIMGAIEHLRRHGPGALEVRAEVQARYNAALSTRLGRSVWASGCLSWYQDAGGKNSVLWPGSTAEFRRRTWRFDPESYRLGPG